MMYYGNMTEEEFVDEAKRRYQTSKLSEEFRRCFMEVQVFYGEYNMISDLVKKDVGIDTRVEYVLETPSWEELKNFAESIKLGKSISTI